MLVFYHFLVDKYDQNFRFHTHVFYRKILHCNEMPDRKLKAAKAAFDASIDGGITFFDCQHRSIDYLSAAAHRNSCLGMLLVHEEQICDLDCIKSNEHDKECQV